ncbi:MAG: hypothetical protein ACK55I_05205, partial [bacterium]
VVRHEHPFGLRRAGAEDRADSVGKRLRFLAGHDHGLHGCRWCCRHPVEDWRGAGRGDWLRSF